MSNPVQLPDPAATSPVATPHHPPHAVVNVERFGTFILLLAMGMGVFLCAVGGLFWAQKSYSVTSPNDHHHHPHHHHQANEPAADPMQGSELGVRQPPG